MRFVGKERTWCRGSIEFGSRERRDRLLASGGGRGLGDPVLGSDPVHDWGGKRNLEGSQRRRSW